MREERERERGRLGLFVFFLFSKKPNEIKTKKSQFHIFIHYILLPARALML